MNRLHAQVERVDVIERAKGNEGSYTVDALFVAR